MYIFSVETDEELYGATLRKRSDDWKERRQIQGWHLKNTTPSILFQVYYRWPQQNISFLIVAEMTPEIANWQVTSNSIALQTTSIK